jgi:citrate synthase
MDPPDGRNEWLSAAAAARLLGVERATLYAYVSRGKVESRPRAGSRARLYLRADLERLRTRSDARAGHAAVAAGAMRWGEPVLDSAITEIRSDGHRYRGEDARVLVARGFEAVTELLWGAAPAPGSAGASARAWPRAELGFPPARIAALLPAEARPLDAATLALPALALTDPLRLHPGREAALRVARRLVRVLAASLGLPDRAAASLAAPTTARAVLAALGSRPSRAAAAAMETALVLSADHELNPSSFAARVAASAGADLYACVGAALATLSGPRHGGVADRVALLVAEVERPEHAARVLDERLRRGDHLPGFGHPLYPHGDPRCAPLLEAARRVRPKCRTLAVVDALVGAMTLAGAPAATIDVGLVALGAALGLGPGAPVAIFAAGRVAGWIAHALEQREAGFLLRPRARYVPRSEPGLGHG